MELLVANSSFSIVFFNSLNLDFTASEKKTFSQASSFLDKLWENPIAINRKVLDIISHPGVAHLADNAKFY